MNRWRSLVVPAALSLLVIAAACGGGGDDDDGGDGPVVGDVIEVAQLSEGDCFLIEDERRGRIREVELTSCRRAFEYEVVGLFEIDEDGDYPDEDVFEDAADDECDAWDRLITPSEDSWEEDDDRTVFCLEEGDSGEPEVGDDVVLLDLPSGACINDEPDSSADEVELADCEGEHEFVIADIFEVDDEDEYPDDDFFADAVDDACDAPDLYAAPDEDSWDDGNRTVVCLNEAGGDDETPTEAATEAPTERPTQAPTERPTQSSGGTNRPGDVVTFFDLNEGDCFNQTAGGEAEIVSCDGAYEFQVTGLFDVPDAATYPGEAYFQEVALAQCASGTVTYLYPTDGTWAQGDREVVCLAPGGGETSSGPQPGDVLPLGEVDTGYCFTVIPDSSDVEIASCDGAYDYLVTLVFAVDDQAQFPGAEYLAGEANASCPTDSDTFVSPNEAEWAQGRREIQCFAESDGTGGDGSMSQIVSLFDLFPGDCFVEIPNDVNYVELVSCNGPYDYRVTDVFDVPDAAAYPGEAYFGDVAADNCSVDAVTYLYPTDGTWSQGDREVVCLAEA